MPGVIGASIFSPRPARGYRFQSLHVEIIIVLLQPRKAQSFSIFGPAASIFCRVLNVLLQKSFLRINLSRTGPAVTDQAGQSTANYGKSSSSAAFGVT